MPIALRLLTLQPKFPSCTVSLGHLSLCAEAHIRLTIPVTCCCSAPGAAAELHLPAESGAPGSHAGGLLVSADALGDQRSCSRAREGDGDAGVHHAQLLDHEREPVRPAPEQYICAAGVHLSCLS